MAAELHEIAPRNLTARTWKVDAGIVYCPVHVGVGPWCWWHLSYFRMSMPMTAYLRAPLKIQQHPNRCIAEKISC